MSGIPIALRVVYRDSFVRGPFHLRSFSYPVAIGAITWIAFISIAFILPQINVSPSLLLKPIRNLIARFLMLDTASRLANLELLDCRGRRCCYLQCRVLACERQEVVHRTNQTD